MTIGFCICQDEWIGAEVGLSWYSLKFRDRAVELGYVKHCEPRLRINCFKSMCMTLLSLLVGVALKNLELLFDGASLTVGSTDLEKKGVDPPWVLKIKLACLVLVVIPAFCYVVVHLVPRLKQCMGSFARESFCVTMCIAIIALSVSSGHFQLSKLLQKTIHHADYVRVKDNQYQMMLTFLIMTGSHLMVPVRWYMLIPVELVSIFWFPFWVLFTSGWNSFYFDMGTYNTLYLHVVQCIIVVIFAMGKRHTECAERYLFKKYLSEKSLRVVTEFKLSSQLTKEKGAPSEISSQKAFANLGLSGELKGKVDRIVALGRKERWVLDAGVTIDHDRVIGQGGFGKVCMAHMHGTPVVVKVPLIPMHEWVGIEASHLQALGNEIRLLRRLRHPNIVLFHGAVFLDRNTSFGLVLECVDGVELNACFSQLSKSGCLRVCLDLSRALQYLHAQDPPIVHGDLKPSNLMILQVFGRPQVKLIDFGLARLLTPNALAGGGTKEWIPPEQMLNPGMQPNQRLDIFAFGSIAYFTEYGLPPIRGVSSDSEWPNSQRAFLTGRARDVVHSCLAVSPGMRPESMDEVRHSLQEAVECLRSGPEEQLSASSLSEVKLSASSLSEVMPKHWSSSTVIPIPK